jgi:hypothetical protein
MDTTQVITAIIAAVVAVAGTIFTYASQSRKDRDNARIESVRLQEEVKAQLWGTAREHLQESKQRIDKLEADFEEEREKRRSAEERVTNLERVVEEEREKRRVLENTLAAERQERRESDERNERERIAMSNRISALENENQTLRSENERLTLAKKGGRL